MYQYQVVLVTELIDGIMSPLKGPLVIDMSYTSLATSTEVDSSKDDSGSETEIAADWCTAAESSPVKRSERLKEHDEATQEKVCVASLSLHSVYNPHL